MLIYSCARLTCLSQPIVHLARAQNVALHVKDMYGQSCWSQHRALPMRLLASIWDWLRTVLAKAKRFMEFMVP